MTKKKDLQKKVTKLQSELDAATELRLRSEERAVLLAEALDLIGTALITLSIGEERETTADHLLTLASTVRTIVNQAATEALADITVTNL